MMENQRLLDYAHQSVTEADLPRIWRELREGGHNALDLSYNEVKLGHVRIPADLPKLEYLYLYKSGIKTVELAGSLPKLSILHLGENQLETFRLPAGFPKLEHLRLDKNKLKTVEFDAPEQLQAMRSLFLKGNEVENIPKEILGEEENCWENMQGYLSSLEKGVAENDEVKLIFVGNSTVGKTTLIKYLAGEPIEDQEDTTHGIEVYEIPMENLKAFTWDFGGQEYYHATHRLFLSNDAVYCLLWNKKTNKQEFVDTPIIKKGIKTTLKLEHYPYEYWLQNIRYYAPDSPIILAQSRNEDREAIGAALLESYQVNPTAVIQLCVHSLRDYLAECPDTLPIEVHMAKNEWGRNMMGFRDLLQKALSETATKFKLGVYWVRIKDAIRAKAGAGEYRMPLDTFRAFCRSIDPSLGDNELRTLTEYLVKIGVILHYPNSPLEGTVFIKPTWVTDRIYEVLDDDVQKAYGVFDMAHVKRALEFHEVAAPEDIEGLAGELVQLMQNFNLIFSPKNQPDQFIAVQYLHHDHPNPKAFDRLKKHISQLSFVLRDAHFLPKAVFNRFMAHYGYDAKKDDYWKYGILFTHRKTDLDVLVEYKFEDHAIVVQMQEDQPELARELFEKLREFVEKETHLQVSVDEKNFVALPKLEEAIEDQLPSVRGINNEKLNRKDFDKLFEKMKPDKPVLNVFISYAHAYGEYFKVFKDLLETNTANYPDCQWNIWTDEKIPLGSKWHEEIQNAIKKSDLAILLVSDKFMTSDYIHKNEVQKLVEQSNTLVVPVYFYPCRFSDWAFLKDHQLFKPKGEDYGRADRDKREKFCFGDLVQFTMHNGVKLPDENPYRTDYILDFIDELKPEINKIIASKK